MDLSSDVLDLDPEEPPCSGSAADPGSAEELLPVAAEGEVNVQSDAVVNC